MVTCFHLFVCDRMHPSNTLGHAYGPWGSFGSTHIRDIQKPPPTDLKGGKNAFDLSEQNVVGEQDDAFNLVFEFLPVQYFKKRYFIETFSNFCKLLVCCFGVLFFCHGGPINWIPTPSPPNNLACKVLFLGVFGPYRLQCYLGSTQNHWTDLLRFLKAIWWFDAPICRTTSHYGISDVFFFLHLPPPDYPRGASFFNVFSLWSGITLQNSLVTQSFKAAGCLWKCVFPWTARCSHFRSSSRFHFCLAGCSLWRSFPWVLPTPAFAFATPMGGGGSEPSPCPSPHSTSQHCLCPSQPLESPPGASNIPFCIFFSKKMVQP